MADLAVRFDHNPILTRSDVHPSHPDWVVTCVLNPGAFEHDGRTALVLRVAERPIQPEGHLRFPIFDETAPDGVRVLTFALGDPGLDAADPRVIAYRGESYLTTLSHLRLAWSDDRRHFQVDDMPTLIGKGPYESFGIEDCRVVAMEDEHLLTYTSTSPFGVTVSCARTRDWHAFERLGVIMPPHNKDVAIFEQKFSGRYCCMHRPSGLFLATHNIWLAFSPDLRHWGDHRCIAKTRPGMWDEERIGAGAAPIRTEKGWLEIYHGADRNLRYSLGALLLDLDDPTKVIARSDEPIMEPIEDYEQHGFFNNCVFTNGHTVDGDTIYVYYGASDTVVCGATMSIQGILASLL